MRMSLTDAVAHELTARKLRPADVRAVYVGGSQARGWSHALSDTDVFVVSADRWEGAVTELQQVTVEPDTVPVAEIYVDDQRWELRYWQETQIDQLVERMSWEAFEAGRIAPSPVELVCLERLMHPLPVGGERWLAARRRAIADSALQAFLTTRALARADASVEDVVGLLESGDVRSAVLAAQVAFVNLVDAVAASHGECGQEWKWRDKRMHLLNPAVLPYDEYWDIATMRCYDPDKPEAWARHVVDVCRRVSGVVPIG
jgi:hypothetical protein